MATATDVRGRRGSIELKHSDGLMRIEVALPDHQGGGGPIGGGTETVGSQLRRRVREIDAELLHELLGAV